MSKKNIFASPESMLICLGKSQASEVEDSAATCHRYPGSLRPLKFQYLQLLYLRTVYTVRHMRGALGFSGFRFWCPLLFPCFQFFSIWFSVFGNKNMAKNTSGFPVSGNFLSGLSVFHRPQQPPHL